MADGHQTLSSSPSSSLEEGEFVPQKVSTCTISAMVTGQSHSKQGHPLPMLNNQPQLNNQSQKPSYASILQAQELNSRAVSIAQGQIQSQPSSDPLTMVKYRDPTTTILKPISQHQGKPAVHFLVSEKEALVEKLNLVLIGKFTHGRPSLSNIKIFFQKFKLQDVINVSLADSKHIYIECSNLSDYYWIWLHLSMKIHGFDMRIFKWGADFSPRIESPIAPVWIRIVGMPLYLFDELSLWQIASAVGKPIRIDSRNLNRSILSFARVCVELDISQQLTDTIWVCIKKENTDIVVKRICLQVFYDVLPLYCTACSHIGHGEEMCKKKIGNGSATLNVEPTVSVVATTCSDPLQSVTTVWLPEKKNNTALKLNSENRFSSINLLGGEASKALGMSENDLACVANEPPKTEAANVIELDPLPRNEDEAAQTLQNNPAAKLECNMTVDVEIAAQNGSSGSKSNLANMEGSKDTQDQKHEMVSSVPTMSELQGTNAPDLRQQSSKKQAPNEQIFEVTGRKCYMSNGEQKRSGDMVASIDLTASSTQEKFEIQNTKVHMVGSVDDHRDPLVIVEGKRLDVKQSTTRFNVLEGNKAEQNERPVIPTTTDDAVKLQQIVKPDSPKAVHAAGQLAISGEDVVCAAYAVVDSAQDGQIADAASQFVQHQITVINGTILQGANQIIVGHNADTEGAASQAATQAANTNISLQHIGKGSRLEKADSIDIEQDAHYDRQTQVKVHTDSTIPLKQGEITTLATDQVGLKSEAINVLDEDTSTQEWQLVGKKINKTKGVVTRSQTKNANSTWADKVEDDQVVDQTPISTMVQAGNKSTQDSKTPTKSRYQIQRKVDKLFSRLSSMNMRDGIRRQLRAELQAHLAELKAHLAELKALDEGRSLLS